jgi:[histone H3]-dimethyl-L-lysine9 demethylase
MLFCSNKCQTSIVDFHRTCCNCAYDLCLACCVEFRGCHQPKADEAASSGKNAVPDDNVTLLSGEVMSGVNEEVQDGKESTFNGQLALPGQVLVFGGEEAMPNGAAASFGKEALLGDEAENPGGLEVVPSGEEVISAVSPDLWLPRADGQIPCPPKQLGGCGSSVLELQSLLGEISVSELLQKTSEITSSDPYFKEDDLTCKCECMCRSDKRNKRKAANREHAGDNYVYCPQGREVMTGELDHFQKHWMKGEPVIVRDVLELTSGLSWEPMVMWRALRETRDKDQVERLAVIAVDCRDWTFVCFVFLFLYIFFRSIFISTLLLCTALYETMPICYGI